MDLYKVKSRMTLQKDTKASQVKPAPPERVGLQRCFGREETLRSEATRVGQTACPGPVLTIQVPYGLSL